MDRGGTAEQAFWGGLAAGAAEMFFEKYSVENLLEKKSITGWRSFVRETLKQGGIEASEEMCTEIANILSDTAIMGANSNFAQAVKKYRDQGMTEEQAKRQAYLDMVGRVGWAGAGGFISGEIMGGFKAGIDYAGQQQYNQYLPKLEEWARQMYDAQQEYTGTAVEAQKTAPIGEAESTVIDTDPATHTPEQMAVIKAYQGAVNGKILEFVNRWKNLINADYRKKVRIDIAHIDARTVRDVQRVVGVDVSDFSGHSLSGNALEHIEIRHGPKGEADHSMADPHDIARMGYVLENYDDVERLLDEDGIPCFSHEFRNADGSRAPLVRFKKKVNGTYYVVEAVPDSSAKMFRVVSAYMN